MFKDDIGLVAYSPTKIFDFCNNNVVIKAVACGEAHTLFLDSEGKVYSCGWSEDGQLGCSTFQSIFSTKKIFYIASLQSKIVKVSAGSIFSACLSELGQVFLWGNGEQGQLAQGFAVKNSQTPLVLNSLNHEFIIDIVCGESHALCISQSGKVFAWGQGIAGFFNDQALYPIGSDIISFGPRNISMLKSSSEYLFKNVNSHAKLAEKLTERLNKVFENQKNRDRY